MTGENHEVDPVKLCSKIGELVGILIVSWQGGEAASAPVIEVQPEPELLTPTEAAKALKISLGTLRNWDKEGVLPRVPGLGPRIVRYRKRDVDKLQNRKRE